MATRAAIDDFLAQKHFAIVGLSRDAVQPDPLGPSLLGSARAFDRPTGVAIVDAACPLMLLEPTASVHRLHRAELRLTHRLPSWT